MNIVQFGDGNFIRGFINYMYENTAKDREVNIYSIQSRSSGKGARLLNEQNNQYYVLEAGLKNGVPTEEVMLIRTIKEAINPYEQWEQYAEIFSRNPVHIIYSNTTEAGLVDLKEPFKLNKSCVGYPAKLLQLLYLQYKNNFTHTIHVLPLELIHKNGEYLKGICLQILSDWEIEEEFFIWMEQHVTFINTLVDRIVSGYPKDRDVSKLNLKFEDKLLTQVEPYYLFAIEGTSELDSYLNLSKRNENVLYINDLNKIGKLKIELLNAVHTIIANIGSKLHIQTVKEAITNNQIQTYLADIVNVGIISTSTEYEEKEGKTFYNQVVERFQNPYINHYLKDILLNNPSKVQSRVNPIFLRNLSLGNEKVIKSLLQFYIVAYRNDFSNDISRDHLADAYFTESITVFKNSTMIQQILDDLLKEQ